VRTVHLIGIGGSGMSGLAGLFSEAGWHVTGCNDGRVYPPASVTLDRLGIQVDENYSVDHLDPPPDLVVVGNVVRETNPEDERARAMGLVRSNLAKALFDHFISRHVSVVVAGTHGKTTCTSMLAYLLEKCGEDPSFLVGGVIRDLETNYRYGEGKFFVAEGDEYDCAWFDKRPKFLHYAPHHLLITNIEYDHADIYVDLEAVKSAFRKLIRGLPDHATLVYCSESSVLRELASEAECRVESYALSETSRTQWTGKVLDKGEEQRFELLRRGQSFGAFSFSLPGRHNLSNAVGVLALLNSMSIPLDSIRMHLPRFSGAARRMETVVQGKVMLLDDFAHHPTEVLATLSAVKERWPGRRIWALYEPKTQTSRRSIAQDSLAASLSMADRVMLLEPVVLPGIPSVEQLDLARLVSRLESSGTPTASFGSVSKLLSALIPQLGNVSDLIVIMSAGSFGGIREKLEDSLISL